MAVKRIKTEAIDNFVDLRECKVDRMLEYMESAAESELKRIKELRQRVDDELDSIGDVSDETFYKIQRMYNAR